MSDLIYRQDALETLRTCYEEERWGFKDGNEYINYGQAVREFEHLPAAQPEPAIPISWLEKEIECLESRKNSFAVLDAMQLKALIKRWRGEQNEAN